MSAEPAAETTPRANILVVDDEPGLRRSVSRILGHDHNVTEAASGQEALDILREQPQDLAIVDVRMPGMTGFEVLKRIKAEYPDTEVIIMTGSISNPEEKLVEAIRERAFYFINKPFERTVLRTLVERCLELQRLSREKRAYTEALERDLERARAFQQLLLPRAFPRVVGLRTDVHYEPSETVGGDFYDFFRLSDTVAGVLIADVAGHGVAAALFTGMLKAEMRAVHDEWRSPEKLFERINEHLLPLTQNQYVTGILLVIDVEAHTVRYVNAGHPDFLGPRGEAYESTGAPLGMLSGWTYDVGELRVRPGSRLLLYTDGFVEARSPAGEEFGRERLRTAFLETAGLPTHEALAALRRAVGAFTGRERLEDDATALLVEVAR